MNREVHVRFCERLRDEIALGLLDPTGGLYLRFNHPPNFHYSVIKVTWGIDDTLEVIPNTIFSCLLACSKAVIAPSTQKNFYFQWKELLVDYHVSGAHQLLS